MWQPNSAEWRIMWALAVFLILAWPATDGSLGVKAVRWMADPADTLPEFPGSLSMGVDDDADAVAAHDAQEAEYYRVSTSALGRLRLRLKTLQDPFQPSTERQMLLGLIALSALGIWRHETGQRR